MNTKTISDFLSNLDLVNVYKKGDMVLFICKGENGLVGVQTFLGEKDLWSLADWGKDTTEKSLVEYFFGK